MNFWNRLTATQRLLTVLGVGTAILFLVGCCGLTAIHAIFVTVIGSATPHAVNVKGESGSRSVAEPPSALGGRVGQTHPFFPPRPGQDLTYRRHWDNALIPDSTTIRRFNGDGSVDLLVESATRAGSFKAVQRWLYETVRGDLFEAAVNTRDQAPDRVRLLPADVREGETWQSRAATGGVRFTCTCVGSSTWVDPPDGMERYAGRRAVRVRVEQTAGQFMGNGMPSRAGLAVYTFAEGVGLVSYESYRASDGALAYTESLAGIGRSTVKSEARR